MKNNRQLQTTNYKLLTQSGAALLITMLLIAGVGALALAVSRIVLSEIRISSAYADGIVAYQAAEAGIERGLLEFRFNRNIEANFNDQELGDCATDDCSIYNLDINFRQEGTVERGPVERDERVEINVSDLGDYQLDAIVIEWHWAGNSAPGVGGLERILIKEDGTVKLGTGPDDGRHLYLPGGGSEVGSISTRGIMTIILKPIGKGLESLTINDARGEKPVDTGITKVESTGTYGRTQRKLVAEIDRMSGQIIGLFDYTLYAGGDEPEGYIRP